MDVLCIIPARLESTRLPRKMLLDETGIPLVIHTYRNAARVFDDIAIATDSDEIMAAAAKFGATAIKTSKAVSGTDRVAEAANLLTHKRKFDVVVNVQGDEPEIGVSDLAALVATMTSGVPMATLATPFLNDCDIASGDTVKVIVGRYGNAFYFTRSPLRRYIGGEFGSTYNDLRHIGVYAYRYYFLQQFVLLQCGRLEEAENLEQLRALEYGFAIGVATVADAQRGIDTRRDYDEFVARWKRL